MRGSTTYQAILREGRNEGLIAGRNEGRVGEAQRILLMLGGDRFGEPDETTRSVVESIHDIDRLESMSRRVLNTTVGDWDGLLDTP